MKSIRLKIIDAVKSELAKTDRGAHTIDHIMRVHKISMLLTEGQNGNTRVIEAAALLHDIGRPREEETGISHSILSGDMSRKVLKDIGYRDDEIEQVVAAIRTHRFSEGIEPTTREGQILSDADKLDAIGAIGIYRAIAQAAASGRGIQGFLKHADEKLLKLRDLMFTEKAKKMATTRHEILESFVNLLREEMYL
ncbi:HD domain-containing protein [Candidatus Thorarchaeota archaeon]|nr:MAG: HD domain-containing protein [Candidatus Thorarchaeota archaeon]